MRLIFAPALCLVLAACMLGPDYTPPAPPSAPGFNHAAPSVNEQSDPAPDWWAGFADPELNRLMRTAIAGSPNLQESLLRIEQAHQNTVTSAAQGLPSLNAAGSYIREEEGLKGLAESSGAYNDLNQLATTANNGAPGSGATVNNGASNVLNQLNNPINFYQYELSSSWELDLFGKVRRTVEASRAAESEAKDAARDSLVMLESQVGQSYFELRAAQAALAQQQEIVQAAQTELQLTTSRAQSGLAPQSDIDQAKTEFLTAQGQLPVYEKQVAQSLDQIAVLAGQPPGALDAQLGAAAPLAAPPPIIGAGLPSSLAERRPDIREAADALHQATAQIGVAVASFYPDVSLTGSLGFHALDASYLTNWANLFYAFGPSISLPIFEGGKLTANLKLARIAQQTAALQYRATVLNALAEVENALVAYRWDQQAAQDAQATAQAAGDTLALAQSRYAHGLTSYLPVLDAQRSFYSAQQQSIQAQAQMDEDVVTLYTALGGGWQENEQTPQPPPIDSAPPIAPGALDAVVP
jgi:NodT family efflux transporter outer membrane factor (OMF) lipoprotein